MFYYLCIMVTFIQNNLGVELRHPSEDCPPPRVRGERERARQKSLQRTKILDRLVWKPSLTTEGT